jgi:hypothetical protein
VNAPLRYLPDPHFVVRESILRAPTLENVERRQREGGTGRRRERKRERKGNEERK